MDAERVPSQFAISLLRRVRERGHDLNVVLHDAGLDFNLLDRADPAWRPEISAMQYTRIYQQALRLLQDETFGLHPGRVVTPGAFRMMCYCVISCENLGRAIRRMTEFQGTFFPEGAQLQASLGTSQCAVGYRDMGGRGPHRVDAVDACGLSIWHRFFGWLTGRPLILEKVEFSGERPENPGKYQELFGCPVHYNQAAELMYFNSQLLSWPLVHTEQSLQDFLRTAPYQLLVMTSEHQQRSLAGQVRAMIGHDFSQGFPSFATISSALNMSAPTLRRRLKREGATFQQLKDDCRCEAAKSYLSREGVSINQVARQMGFTDPSAFHRSFRKWTGKTPGEYRAQGLA